VRKINSPDK